MNLATHPLTVVVNGKSQGPLDVPEGLMMLDFLNEYLNLTGSRFGCGQGVCRACTVILDKKDGTSAEIRTCITGAHFFDGKRIRTVEGHAQPGADGELVLSPIQQQFLEH